MLIDTHAHLYWDSFKADFDEVIQRALNAGVNIIINVGVDVEKSKVAANLNSDKIKFYSTVGIHPHEALRLPFGKLRIAQDKLFEEIEELERLYLSNPKIVVAVGECGLDYLDADEQTKSLQRKLFKAQIDLAKKLNLPLIIHCRDDRSQNPNNSQAWDEVVEMTKSHWGIYHCYSGLPSTTDLIIKSTNFSVSFAGNLTYPKNEYLKEAVKALPMERITIETDCPFLPPQSKRGQRNEPANILEIAQMVADLKGVRWEEVAKQTSTNVQKLFAFQD